MARTKATEKSPKDKFVNAIPHLEDITTIHTDPNIASWRANLTRGGSNINGAVSDDIVRALEALGIANAVADRFCSTPQHHAHAVEAAFGAGTLAYPPREWLAKRDAAAGVGASASTLGEGHDWYRAFLLTCLDWVHKDASSDGASTCLCPVTAYLQLILCQTPMEDWAAAATDPPDASPLAFAWAWARNIPGTGRRTADVAVLVTMGRQVHRSMAYKLWRAKKARRPAFGCMELAINVGVWASLRGVVKVGLKRAATRLRASSDLENDKRAEELLAIVRNAAELLGEAGERYAELLGEKDVAEEREGVVDSIRSLAGFILRKAEPPAPEKVLLAITGLATADQ